MNKVYQQTEQKDYRHYTPVSVALWLHTLLADKVCPIPTILDPCVGTGRLTDPWEQAFRVGVDVEDQDADLEIFLRDDFLSLEEWVAREPDVILCNPPFSRTPDRRRMHPELFLRKCCTLFGYHTPMAFFVPIGFRLNQHIVSSRYRWIRDSGLRISSIVALPVDLFPGVKFFSEIVLFNVDGLDPHYFLPERVLQ